MEPPSELGRLWRNIPIPEYHAGGILVAFLLHVLIPRRLVTNPGSSRLAGSLLVAVGLALAGWATWTARDVELESPGALVSGGPYSFSRNPMYLAWSAIQAGLALSLNSAWVAASVPLVALMTDRQVVRNEEHALEQAFGQAYVGYRQKVRRWL
jgi:protein-S-isoprenylcysteine O-methyltransferase Ste14